MAYKLTSSFSVFSWIVDSEQDFHVTGGASKGRHDGISRAHSRGYVPEKPNPESGQDLSDVNVFTKTHYWRRGHRYPNHPLQKYTRDHRPPLASLPLIDAVFATAITSNNRRYMASAIKPSLD